jgi:hypothetical protein
MYQGEFESCAAERDVRIKIQTVQIYNKKTRAPKEQTAAFNSFTLTFSFARRACPRRPRPNRRLRCRLLCRRGLLRVLHLCLLLLLCLQRRLSRRRGRREKTVPRNRHRRFEDSDRRSQNALLGGREAALGKVHSQAKDHVELKNIAETTMLRTIQSLKGGCQVKQTFLSTLEACTRCRASAATITTAATGAIPRLVRGRRRRGRGIPKVRARTRIVANLVAFKAFHTTCTSTSTTATTTTRLIRWRRRR